MISTWSKLPQTVGTTPLNYNFTSDSSKAFGDNMVEVNPGVWAFFSGELNADGNVDLLDYSLWEADANNFAFGVYATDLNGDGNVDLLDYSIWEANANNFVFSYIPL